MARTGARRSVLALAVVALTALAAGACSSESGPPDVAAVVATGKGYRVEIAASEVERLLDQYRQGSEAARDQALAAEAPASPLPDVEGRRFVLEFLIRLAVLDGLAIEHGVSSESGRVLDLALESADVSDFAGTAWTPGDLKEGLQAGVLSKALAEKLFPEVAVSEPEIAAHWEAVKDNFRAGWSAGVRAAFLPTAEAGEKLRVAVTGGADFDETATSLAALQVGSMGTVSSATPQVSPQLRTMIEGLRPGDLSPPTPAAGGFVVLLVESRQDVPARTLEDVRDEVTAAVADQKRQRLFLDWLDERVTQAEVTVDSWFGRWNPERGTVSGH